MHSVHARASEAPSTPRGLASPWPVVKALAAMVLAAMVLAGCASGPSGRDGPGARPPPDLQKVPDARPRVEPLRVGGPNKPYAIAGRSYVPMTTDEPLRQTGLASWYGRKFHGRPTALGETYDMYAMSAAHATMPLPSYAVVRNPANGRQVVVRVNDRGPFVRDRIIDLSYTAALRLGLLAGVAPVEVERLTHDDIRSGRWQAAMAEDAMLQPAATATATLSAVDGDSPGYWVQLGAFRQAEGARGLQQRLQSEAGGLAPGVAVLDEDGLLRVQAGPWATREDAEQAAAELRARLGLAGVVVQRR
jgi:rare lipoprotein A